MGGYGVEFHPGVLLEEVFHSPLVGEENDELTADISSDFDAGAQVKFCEGLAGDVRAKPPDLIEGSWFKARLGPVFCLKPVRNDLKLKLANRTQ